MLSKIVIIYSLASVFIEVIHAQYIRRAGLHGNSAVSGNPEFGNPGLGNLALAGENAALNKMANGHLANGMAMNSAFSSMAGYNQELGSFNGGGLLITSSSPIAPSGMTVHSENLIVEGPLAVTGQLPFLGVVGVEGPLQATGQGTVTYGGGNGNIGMVGENLNGMSGAALGNSVGTGLNGMAGPSMAAGMGGIGMPGRGVGIY